MTKWALLLGILGTFAIGAIYLFTRHSEESLQVTTSDARSTRGAITIGMDNWVGYFPLCSPEMKKRQRHTGYTHHCKDDGANYSQRMRDLREGKIQFAVATVDAYLLNAVRENYPGVIMMVIDQSKGGDAIVAWKDSIPNLEALKKTPVRVAYTPDSPSHHLLKVAGTHFDIPFLRTSGEWQKEVNGSQEALKFLLKKKSEVAVLWEPDVSKALDHDGVVKLLGTEDTSGIIVDILLVAREILVDDPAMVQAVAANYFRTLKFYRENPSRLIKDVKDYTGVKKEAQVKAMLEGVSWVNLQDNASTWFGVQVQGGFFNEALIDVLESTSEILVGNGDFERSPIPDADPYRLISSNVISTLFQSGIGEFESTRHQSKSESGDSLTHIFSALSDDGWNTLRQVGALRVRPIIFQSGTSRLSLLDKQQLDKAAENLRHYPNYRVLVKGHTGLRGDAQVNQRLSQERAEAVVRYLNLTYGIDQNRVKALGMGSNEPLPRIPGENNRRYNGRLPRVEMHMMAELF